MRRDELTRLTVDNIEERSLILVVKIPDSKTHSERTFTITHLEYIGKYKKYAALRPVNASTNRFFYKYTKGKCVNQVVGINKLGAMPSIVAKFLNLPDANQYTGHCFRRTSATLLADSGANITEVKRHGGWKSTTVAESYIEDSIQQKNKISNKILDVEISKTLGKVKNTSEDNNKKTVSGVDVSNCVNVTVNVYNYVPQ